MSNTEFVYSVSSPGDKPSGRAEIAGGSPVHANCLRGRRRISLALCACGALPALVMAAISPARSTCLLWVFGTLPWIFGALAATGLPTHSGRAWNPVLGGVLLLDGSFVVGTLLSRDVYYTMMLHATPFLNIALLVSGYALLMISPVVTRRLFGRRSISVASARRLRQSQATNLAPR